MINRDYETIYEALKKNKLAFFIGSGFSKAECDDYPLWPEVLETLKMDLAEGNQKDPLYKETDALKIAQFHRLKFGKGTTKKTTKDAFPKVAVPGDLTKRLLNLYPHCIVTTNWDRLFDNAVNDSAYIYDVIAADYELVESESNSKIIKMHGDFEHDNYVFTEEDYLNYQDNFPLIENYVKSIISTHVVIFLGYSFNDIDLKQIFNWFQNKSTIQPAAYLVQVGANNVLRSYLKKYGITVIDVIPPEKEITNEVYKEAIDKLIANIENFEENKYSNDAFEYVLQRIRKYRSCSVVLQSQLIASLGNCKITKGYDGKNYLQFYDKLATGDYNEKRRCVYKKFVETLNDVEWQEKNKDRYLALREIFFKCDVNGVAFADALVKGCLCHVFEGENKNDDIKEFQNFCYSLNENPTSLNDKMKRVYCLYNLRDYKRAYDENKGVIESCKKEKNWKNLFIAIFNQKIISFFGRFGNGALVNKEWNLDDVFHKLPFEIQNECSDLYLFLKDGGLYTELSKAQSKLDDIKEKIDKEGSGTVFLHSEKEYDSLAFDNLVYYILGNYICIDQHKVYADICRKYLECSILSQRRNPNLSLSKNEVYAFIKSLDQNILKRLLKKEDGTFNTLTLNENDTQWLIDATFNCQKNSTSINHLDNAFFVLSLTKLEKDKYEKFLNDLMGIITYPAKYQVKFSQIAEFILCQSHFFKNNPKKYFDRLVNEILSSFADEQISVLNLQYLESGNLGYLFDKFKLSFKDDSLLNKFIAELSKYPLDEQLQYRTNILIPLYRHSDGKCKSIIKKCVHYAKEKDIAIGEFKSIITFNYLLSLQESEIKTWTKTFRQQMFKIMNEMPQDFYSYHLNRAYGLLKKLCKKDPLCKPMIKTIEKMIKINNPFIRKLK